MRDGISVVMCDPRSLDALGELPDVELDGSELSWGYYTDQRMSGTIKALGAGWIDHSLLRVVLTMGGVTQELATGVVQKMPWSRSGGAQVVESEMHSARAMIADDLLPGHWTICAGARSTDVVSELVGGAGRPYLITADAVNHIWSEPKVYEMGDSRLSDLMDVADVSGNRIDVDGPGNITWSRYVPPSARTPTFRLDLSDPKTTVLDGIKGGTSRLDTPTRAVVTYHGEKRDAEGEIVKDADGKAVQVELYAYADMRSTETSGARGYVIATHEQVDDLPDQSQAAIDAKAREAASRLTADKWREWELSCAYTPLRMGDVGELVLPDGVDAGLHKVLVKNLKLDLKTLVMDLTLKEV